MRTITCDHCGKVLNPKKDAHYSINSLDYSEPGCQGILLKTSVSGEEIDRMEGTRSWVDYTDIDFCVPCFESTGLKKLLIKA